MKKYIHYCWFGGKPLSKLAQKCLRSWKKYLPNCEIIRWDESNCDINECKFTKEAYESKKWAMVADYFRTKAINEYGGLYLDTDVEITKDISNLLDNTTFLGIEETGAVNAAVWYEKNHNSYLAEKLLEIYQSFDGFDIKQINNISIPKLITKILLDCGYKDGENKKQILKHDITIYPRDYFYPLTMDRSDSMFTDNTCMIHYYDASWITRKQKLEMYMVRKIGRAKTVKLEVLFSKVKNIIKRIMRLCLFPIVLLRKYKRKKLLITNEYLKRLSNTKEQIEKYKNCEYIAIHNQEWFGVTSATVELFDNLVDCGEIYRRQDIKLIGEIIIKSNIKQVVFSAFAVGWKELVVYLKNKSSNIKIKVYWHGSNSQVLDQYGWNGHMNIMRLYKKGYIDAFATCKNSLIEFYKKNGCNAMFITNKVDINIQPMSKKKSKNVIIGLYAAKCTDWRKNMFTQIAAASLVENAVLDIVPLTKEAKDFADKVNIKVSGVEKSLPREDLLKRMSNNDVNLYVSFSECSPMLPLESMELGVPCITGNNHHYFKNNDLENYIIVKNEADIEEIKGKIELCLNNKEKIKKLYDLFSKKNKQNSKSDVKKFLEM